MLLILLLTILLLWFQPQLVFLFLLLFYFNSSDFQFSFIGFLQRSHNVMGCLISWVTDACTLLAHCNELALD